MHTCVFMCIARGEGATAGGFPTPRRSHQPFGAKLPRLERSRAQPQAASSRRAGAHQPAHVHRSTGLLGKDQKFMQRVLVITEQCISSHLLHKVACR